MIFLEPAEWVSKRVPPGYGVVGARAAVNVFGAALARSALGSVSRETHMRVWTEYVRHMRPDTGVISLARSVLADRVGVSPITVSRVLGFARREGVLVRIGAPRWGFGLPGVAARYVVVARRPRPVVRQLTNDA